MENYYYNSPSDAWTYNEHQYQYQNQQQYQYQEVHSATQPYHYNNDTTMPHEPEPEVDWEKWIKESALSDYPASASNSGTVSQPSTEMLDANWFEQQFTEPMMESDPAFIIDMNLELDEIENILFSSQESLQGTYTSTSTPTSSEATNSNESTSPTTSSSNSPNNSYSTPASSFNGTQQEEGEYPCPSCPRSFEKRHLLNRHLKNHNPSVTCPFRLSHGCTKVTARNRDMMRHVDVHHPTPAAPVSNPATTSAPTAPPKQKKHFCPVPRCVSGREGFGRRDNLGRHMKNVHGMKLSAPAAAKS